MGRTIMKVISIKQLAYEKNVEEKVLEEIIADVIKDFRDGKFRFLLGDAQDKKVIIVDKEDIENIRRNAEKGLLFLADNHRCDTDTFLAALTELRKQRTVDVKTYDKIVEVKNKPNVLIKFAKVKARDEKEATLYDECYMKEKDEALLYIVIHTETNIIESDISFTTLDFLEFTEKLTPLPRTISPGVYYWCRRFKAKKFGEYKVRCIFKGKINGVPWSFESSEATLKISPLPPKIEAELVSINSNQPVYFDEEFNIQFKFHNSGNGDAFDIKIMGLDKYQELEVITGDTLLQIPSSTRNVPHSLKLKAKKSGRYKLENIWLTYKDAEGNLCGKIKIEDDIEFEVETPQPEWALKTDIPKLIKSTGFEQEYRWRGELWNEGAKAKILYFEIPIPQELYPKGQKTFKNIELDNKGSLEFDITFKAPEKEELKLDKCIIKFLDIEGREKTEEIWIGATVPVIGHKRKSLIEEKWPFNSGNYIDGKRYLIMKEIDKGGCGIVYLAIDRYAVAPYETGEVALKVLRREFIENQKIVELFKQEIKKSWYLTKNYKNPNIVSVNDLGEEKVEDTVYPWMAMEYLPETLEKRLEKRGATIEDVIYLMRDMCSALMAARSAEYIHGDIKPSNIFYSKKDGWKLGDFGLTVMLHKGGAKPIGRTLLKTYLAPEFPNLSYASDIYSLGIVFLEMLTGNTRSKASLSVTNLKHGILSNCREDYIQDLVELIQKMTDKNPEERPSLENIKKFTHKDPSTFLFRR
jgi:hypothetical protein